MISNKTTNLEKARMAWGAAMPDWVRAMAEACDRRGQKAVSERLGYSNAVISQVLAKKYPGVLEKVERAVAGAFMGAVVQCPVLGEIDDASCIENQRRPYASTNPTRVRLFQACRGNCPNSTINKGGE